MSDLTHDIEIATKLLLDTINDLDDDVTNGGDIDLERGLVCYGLIEEANRRLASTRVTLTARLAEMMPSGPLTVTGVGTFERHRKTDRTKWDKDELLRVVLDTRRKAIHSDALLDETELQKALHVFPLGTPRVTALRVRGLVPDEWCETIRGGWAIQVTT